MDIIPAMEVELSLLHSHSSFIYLIFDLRSAWASIALLVVAAAATLGVACGICLVIVTHRKGRSIISRSISFSNFSISSDDYESEEEEEEEESEEEEEEKDEKNSVFSSSSDEYESVGGRETDRPEFSWAGPVVRTWEGTGLGFDYLGGAISLLDMNRREILGSFRASSTTATSLATPVLLVTAESGGDGKEAMVAVWDARAARAAGEGNPAAKAEWQTLRRRRAVRVSAGGDGKVYVGDDGGRLMVADLRNGHSEPLAETWWDPNSVNVVDGAAGGEDDLDCYWRGGRLVVDWCRNAVRNFPILPSPK